MLLGIYSEAAFQGTQKQNDVKPNVWFSAQCVSFVDNVHLLFTAPMFPSRADIIHS